MTPQELLENFPRENCLKLSLPIGYVTAQNHGSSPFIRAIAVTHPEEAAQMTERNVQLFAELDRLLLAYQTAITAGIHTQSQTFGPLSVDRRPPLSTSHLEVTVTPKLAEAVVVNGRKLLETLECYLTDDTEQLLDRWVEDFGPLEPTWNGLILSSRECRNVHNMGSIVQIINQLRNNGAWLVQTIVDEENVPWSLDNLLRQLDHFSVKVYAP